MKRKFKAFTLIELIIVIAIFGIIMAGLMNFFKPIRETYVDSTLYEKQRTAQNGIAEYLCESTKYADEISIYDQGATSTADGSASLPAGTTSNSAQAAVQAFIKEHYAGYSGAELDEIKKRIHVICINRSDEYDKTGKHSTNSSEDSDHLYTGRIITNVIGTDVTTLSGDDDFAGLRTKSGGASGKTYMALGGAYYGESDYIISVSVTNDIALNNADKESAMYESAASLTFTISNAFDNSSGVIKNGGDGVSINNDNSSVRVTTENSNILKNMNKRKINYYMIGSEPAGSISPTGTVQYNTKNTYIIYVLPEEGNR